MKDQVITVNKRKYAVGLFWQPVSAGRNARNYARGLARSVNKNLNLYAEYRRMVGLGSSKYGHKNGMQVAAVEVLSSLTEYSSFIAVFDLGANFYLVAVRNGVVLEDKLLTTEEEARSAYVKLFEIPDWNALIAPSAWGMPRAIERKLTDLIYGGARVTLKPINLLRSRLLALCLIVVFALVMLNLFREPLQQMLNTGPRVSAIDPELAAEYKRQIEEKNKELDEQFDIPQPAEPDPIVLPYDNLPDVAQRASVCFQAMGFLMQPISGWNQVSVECGEDFASAQFKRDFGTVGDFYAMATDLMPHSFADEKNENTIILRAKLPSVETGASHDMRDAETISRDIMTMFQAMKADVEVNTVTDTLTNGVDTVDVNVVEVGASSKLKPSEFMEIFGGFDGVYMTRCEWNAVRRIWNYEVLIYAK